MFSTHSHKKQHHDPLLKGTNVKSRSESQQIIDMLKLSTYNIMISMIGRKPDYLESCLSSPELRSRILENSESRQQFLDLVASDDDRILTLLKNSDIFEKYPELQVKLRMTIDSQRFIQAHSSHQSSSSNK